MKVIACDAAPEDWPFQIPPLDPTEACRWCDRPISDHEQVEWPEGETEAA